MWRDFWGYFFELFEIVLLVILAAVVSGFIILAIALFIAWIGGVATFVRWVVFVGLGIVVLAVIAFIMAWKDNH